MKTHLEFVSKAFPPAPGEDKVINPGRFGKRLAEFLRQQLPIYGFAVKSLGPEDWGWRVELEHAAFPLWIGCGNYEEFDHGFLCFIEPSKPVIRKLFGKVDTTATVEKLSDALEAVLRKSGQVSQLRWWAEGEARPAKGAPKPAS